MLLNEDNPNNTDAMLVDQVFGPSFRVYWLDFIHLSPNPHSKARKKAKNPKVGDRENIVIAASDQEVDDKDGDFWRYFILNAPRMSIGGGTDEIQKNTIGERALGLPREPS